jgi:hypothetical protein
MAKPRPPQRRPLAIDAEADRRLYNRERKARWRRLRREGHVSLSGVQINPKQFRAFLIKRDLINEFDKLKPAQLSALVSLLVHETIMSQIRSHGDRDTRR